MPISSPSARTEARPSNDTGRQSVKLRSENRSVTALPPCSRSSAASSTASTARVRPPGVVTSTANAALSGYTGFTPGPRAKEAKTSTGWREASG